MRNLLIVFVIIATSITATAQPTFGIHAGGIMVKTNSDTDEEISFKNRLSWRFGGIAIIPLTETFSFMPQLNLLSKGGKIEESYSEDFMGDVITVDVTGNAKLIYLEVPLNVVYNRTGEMGGFFIGAGPSVSFGLTGEVDGNSKISILGQSESESFNFNVKFDGDDDPDPGDENIHLKRLDIGANILAGYQLSNGLFIKTTYNHGISNISPDEQAKAKSRYFGISIGYFFGANSRY